MAKNRPGEKILYLVLALFSLIVLLPLLFTVLHSFMPPEQVARAYTGLGTSTSHIDLQLVPKPVSVRQYIQIFFGQELEWYFYFNNTILLTVPILLVTILVSTMSGYGLAKFRFSGRRGILTVYIVTLLLPVQVTLVPYFIFFDRLNIMEGRFPLIAFCALSPFGAFLIYQFIKSVPDDAIEAARIEGASEWRIFLKIVLPQASPGISALTILTLIDCFSMIEQPFMLLRERAWYPMSIMLKYLSAQQMSTAFVMAIVFVIPIFLAYLLLQDYLIEGISHTSPGAIK